MNRVETIEIWFITQFSIIFLFSLSHYEILYSFFGGKIFVEVKKLYDKYVESKSNKSFFSWNQTEWTVITDYIIVKTRSCYTFASDRRQNEIFLRIECSLWKLCRWELSNSANCLAFNDMERILHGKLLF